MNNPNSELVVLPFTAKIKMTDIHLTFDQLMFLLNRGNRDSIQIERSYPGASGAIGCGKTGAKVAVARHLLTVVYFMLKRKRPYLENYASNR